MYIHRFLEQSILKSIQHFPVTAVTGPRQCGKSTLFYSYSIAGELVDEGENGCCFVR